METLLHKKENPQDVNIMDKILLLFLILLSSCVTRKSLSIVNKQGSYKLKWDTAHYPTSDSSKIFGTIYDFDYSKALSGSTIQIGQRKFSGDINGNYVINLPPGKYTIWSKAVHYKHLKTKRLKLAKQDSVRIDFYMKPI
ncbi:MAG TPA: hypothetical protein VF623_09510 [Segetibacter sp.]|jgi:hypothetical protein